MDPLELGAALRTSRERAGWTREALAFHSGLSGAAIAQIESGRRRDVRLATVVALATALDMSVDHLIGRTRRALEHRVLFYGSDVEYAASAAPFLIEGVQQDECVLVVTAQRQASLIRDALGRDATKLLFRDSAAWYGSPRAALADYRSFIADRAKSGCRRVRIFGEPVWTGRPQTEVSAWTRYESMINLVLASEPATIVCPYDTRILPEKIVASALHTHPEAVTDGHLSRSATFRDPEDFLLSPP